MTLTGTWLLPIAIIPGVWEACEVPRAPRATQEQIPSPPRPSEADDIIPTETQKGNSRDERILHKSIPGPRVDSLRKQGQNTSKDEPSQDYLDPGPSILQTHPERGHPDFVHSSSGAFHYSQSQYPSREFFIPGYLVPSAREPRVHIHNVQTVGLRAYSTAACSPPYRPIT